MEIDLIPTSKEAAKLAHVAIANLIEHPAYFQMDLWDRVGTIAGVCAAAMILRARLSSGEYEGVLELMILDLYTSDQDGPAALQDCIMFVVRSASAGGTLDPKLLPMALGMWLLWNVRGEEPPDVEMPIMELAGKEIFDFMEKELNK